MFCTIQTIFVKNICDILKNVHAFQKKNPWYVFGKCLYNVEIIA